MDDKNNSSCGCKCGCGDTAKQETPASTTPPAQNGCCRSALRVWLFPIFVLLVALVL